MGRLYDMAQTIQRAIETGGHDPIQVRGLIGLKSRVLLALVKPNTPDDPCKIEGLRKAAEEVLGISI